MNKINKSCPDCGEEMTSYEVPNEGVFFKIPFTQIDIMWRKWNCVDWVCNACACDRQQDIGRGAYESGLEDGYTKAMAEDGRWR